MPCFPKTIVFLAVLGVLLVASVTSNCRADCIACWQLKGVTVRLKDGTTIKGYAIWNEGWALLGYLSSNAREEASRKPAVETRKKFPEVVFDPLAKIDDITVYTHLQSINYPIKDALVATRDPVGVYVKDIQELKLNPGPHDGYEGAGSLPVVSPRIADLLQTKPSASCNYEDSVVDAYWVSYDESFPAEELRRLCEQRVSDKKIAESLEARDVISLYFFYD